MEERRRSTAHQKATRIAAPYGILVITILLGMIGWLGKDKLDSMKSAIDSLVHMSYEIKSTVKVIDATMERNTERITFLERIVRKLDRQSNNDG